MTVRLDVQDGGMSWVCDPLQTSDLYKTNLKCRHITWIRYIRWHSAAAAYCLCCSPGLDSSRIQHWRTPLKLLAKFGRWLNVHHISITMQCHVTLLKSVMGVKCLVERTASTEVSSDSVSICPLLQRRERPWYSSELQCGLSSRVFCYCWNIPWRTLFHTWIKTLASSGIVFCCSLMSWRCRSIALWKYYVIRACIL